MSTQAGGRDTATSPYRVVQWATGNIGTRSMRAVIEHPDLELVGLHVHSAEKVGKDAGELCGVGPVGVQATSSIDEIIALKPDCVLYMQEGYDLDDVCRLLESGINVVSTRSEFHNPALFDPALHKRLEDSCRSGGSSIHSTGSSPGFITEAVPLVLASIQRKLDRLTIDEFADISSRDSPNMIFNLMCFGRDPAEFNTQRSEHIRRAFGPSLALVADALSIPFDSVEGIGEIAVARKDKKIAAGVIKAGTVGAQRMGATLVRGGEPVMRFRANWYCTTDVDADWDLREAGWRVVVEGDAPLDVGIRFPVDPAKWAATTPGYTAHRPVNAIPYVCEAPPGIRTTVDLPQIIARLVAS